MVLLPCTPALPDSRQVYMNEITRLKGSSSLHKKFAANMNRRIFFTEKARCNVCGKQGKNRLQPDKVVYNKEMVFKNVSS